MTLALDKYLLAFIIFSVFMVGGLAVMSGVNTSYPSADVNANLSSSDEQAFRAILSDFDDLSVDMQNKTLNEQTTTLGTLDRLVNGAYKALRLIGGTFNIVPQVLSLVANKLGIPDFFVNAAVAALIILIVITLIYLFMRIIPAGT